MKLLSVFTVISVFFLMANKAAAQNALINILSQKSGMVKKGGILFLEVTVNNTDPAGYIGIYKIKTRISVPSAITSIAEKGHVLPTGWAIISNDGTSITISNGKDMIAASDARTLLIAIRGNTIGGPSTITGQLVFSDGTAPGTAPGVLHGDLPADNSSTTTCQVIR